MLQSLFHFLLSNNTLRVSSAFKIQIKVFCLPKSYSKAAEHYRKLEERQKKMRHFLIGAKGSTNSVYTRKPWLICVPDRIGDMTLHNQCLFVSLVVAYQHLLSLEGSKAAGEFIQQFKSHDSTCVDVLRQCLKDFKMYIETKKATGALPPMHPVLAKNYTFTGPQALEDIFPLFSSFAGVQITAFSDLVSHVCYRYPDDYDQDMRQIYIFVELANRETCSVNVNDPARGVIAGHASVVLKASSYFNTMGKRCLACLTKISNESFHICGDAMHRSRTCFHCKRFLRNAITPVNVQNENEFCDSSMVARETKYCTGCGLLYTSESCNTHHLTSCKKTYFCSKCQKNVRRTKGLNTIEEVKAAHVCHTKFCNNCLSYQLGDHVCQTRDANYQREWCRLALLTVQYIEDGEKNCEDCYNLKKVDSLNLCDRHTAQETSFGMTPNFAALLVEGQRRGVFHEKYFSTDELRPHLSISSSTAPVSQTYTYFPTSMVEKDNNDYCDKRSVENNYQRQKMNQLQSYRNKIALALKDTDCVLLQLLYHILQPAFLNTTIICHSETGAELNALAGLLTYYGLKTKLSSKESTIICVSLDDKYGIRIINNYNYFSEPLSSLNLTFAKVPEVFFPLKLNYPAYYNYDSVLPAKEHFLSIFDAQEHIDCVSKYHSAHVGQRWHFGTQILDFSRFQLTVLASVVTNFVSECIDFQRGLLHDCEIDKRPRTPEFFAFLHPYSKPYCTLPSYSYDCMKLHTLDTSLLYLWKNEFSTGITKGNPSYQETEYLAYIRSTLPHITWEHAYSSPSGQREFCIQGERIIPDMVGTDAFGHIYIYNFCGCHIHIHLDGTECRSYASEGKNHYGQDRAMLADRDRRKQELLKLYFRSELTLVYCYSCQWQEMKRKDPDVRKFMATYIERPKQRLCPRISVRGGISEVYRHSFTAAAEPNKVMESYDVCSLYPYIAMTADLPVGPYQILIGEQLDQVQISSTGEFYFGRQQIHGFLQAIISCPTYCKFPSLLYRDSAGNSIAGLCQECILKGLDTVCGHKDKKRFLKSVWTLPEVTFAITQGYRVIKMLEIYAYFDARPILRPFFHYASSYKIRYSGIPEDEPDPYAWCARINSSMEYSGSLRLSPATVQKSDVRRKIIKLMLVSTIGKFSQFCKGRETHFATSYRELSKLVKNCAYNLDQLFVINENVVQVVRTKLRTSRCAYNKGCSSIHAYITALARIYMLKSLIRLEQNGVEICALDVDGFKCIRSRNCDISQIIPIGCEFGSFKDDLGPNRILDYCALAPRVMSQIMENQETGRLHSKTQLCSFSLQAATIQRTLNHRVYTTMLADRIKGQEKQLKVAQRRHYRKILRQNEFQIKEFCFSNMICTKRVTYSSSKGVLRTRPIGCSLQLKDYL